MALYVVVGQDGNEYGPLDADQVRSWQDQGFLNERSLIRIQGEGQQWHALKTFDELALQPPVLSSPAVESFPESPIESFPESTKPKSNKIAFIIGGVALLGVALFLLLLGIGMLSGGSKNEGFPELHTQYSLEVWPMEMEALRLMERLQGEDDDAAAIRIMQEIQTSWSDRVKTLGAIELSGSATRQMHQEYLNMITDGATIWSKTLEKFRAGDLQGGMEILQEMEELSTDRIEPWVTEFNRQCEAHGLPDITATLKSLSEE